MKRTKYPRTPHHPLSEEVKNDDKLIRKEALQQLIGSEMIATIKADGESSTNYPDGYSHCRSIDSAADETNSWVRGFAQSIGYTLNDIDRLCGENLYAKHSIHYTNLSSYFYCFNIWDKNNVALGWDETVEFCRLRNIHTVKEVWRGTLTEEIVKELWATMDLNENEGLVFRSADPIPYSEFEHKTFKLVRNGHVQTDKHWKRQKLVKNIVVEGGQSDYRVEPTEEFFKTSQ
ncbi:RNA ligase family protein [Vibrio coralliirubri]|uniref:RNA ligase family protein n=1 Tax=Vibrio coralliirubri TaxID=1516159 RepID=UPI0022833549|nr:RNA ligase family protein [Vibrio coralliirubri]MCY9861175.1 RNA ligase family protein [Vibrio coralliirubri]